MDCLWVDPEPATPQKRRYMDESLDARVEMCERLISKWQSLAEERLEGGHALDETLKAKLAALTPIGVGSLRKDMGAAGESVELFRALRALVGPSGKLYWAVGADVAIGMRRWHDKALECTQPGETCDGLLVFTREGSGDEEVREALSPLRCDIEVIPMPSHLLTASSQRARKALVRAATVGNDDACRSILNGSVTDYCLSQPWLLEMYQAQLRDLGRRDM